MTQFLSHLGGGEGGVRGEGLRRLLWGRWGGPLRDRGRPRQGPWGAVAAFLLFDPGLGEQDAGTPLQAQVWALREPLLSAQRPGLLPSDGPGVRMCLP